MDPEVARAARTVADHAILLLALGIGLLGGAVAFVVGAAAVARRYQEPLIRLWTLLLTQARRIPMLRPVLGGVRAAMPTSYVALHLLLGLVATAAIVGFGVIAEEVFAGRTVSAFDHALATALQESASPRWQQLFRAITWFGEGDVLVVVSTAVAVALLLRRQYVIATGWIIAQVGGALLILALKAAFARSRPPTEDALLLESWSFPSGHAMATFVFCGVGAYLLIRSRRSWTLKTIVVAAAFAWCIVMGFTRLYLAVHFASDVVAGLVAATAWVAVCVSGIEMGLRRLK